MDWSRLALDASRFRRNRPQKSSSQERFKALPQLSKNRLVPGGMPTPAPAPPTALLSKGLVPVVVVPAAAAPAPNDAAPAIGVDGVDRPATVADGARPVPNAGPPDGKLPKLRLTWPWAKPPVMLCACGSSSLK